MAPLIVTLALYNAGGLLSLAPWVGESESVTFIAISIYISLTTSSSPPWSPRRRPSGWRRSGAATSSPAWSPRSSASSAISTSPASGAYFTLYDNSRAMGPFKDPNVFGPFLVPPMVWLSQDLLLRRGRASGRGRSS